MTKPVGGGRRRATVKAPEMLRRIRQVVRRDREPDPLVKVAGMPTRHDAETCFEALQSRGMYAEMREGEAGAYELWVHASVEPLARLVLGLSGRSVIRVPRRKGGGGEGSSHA